jgi:hypothetical protein
MKNLELEIVSHSSWQVCILRGRDALQDGFIAYSAFRVPHSALERGVLL